MLALVLPSSLDPPSSKMLCTKFMDLKLLRARHGKKMSFQRFAASVLYESGHFLLLYPPAALACWLARAINEKILRLSKLALVAKQAWFSGHYGRTWIDHDENGLLRNGLEESQSSSPGFLPSRPDEGDMNSIQAGLA